MQTKILTLCFAIHDDRILLGYKKRGFGEGRWNGFGGKVHHGETIKQAAAREMLEECGVEPLEIEQRGLITFEFENDPVHLEVHIFRALSFRGSELNPIETDEMKPQWFSFKSIPYTDMWPDDSIWLPLLIQGKRFGGRALFRGMDVMVSSNIRALDAREGFVFPPDSLSHPRAAIE
jgi:8-oxo-dGTP diphosphatase / 2-hydroxy-dATP diphosphatase